MSDHGKILIIDDDPSARDLLAQFYERKGCGIVLAGNGKEGIGKMSEGPFDIIFLDLNMPEMGGLEVLPHLRDRDQDVHIVITTAFASYDSKVEARGYGVRDYLVKPITLAKLQDIAERYLPKDGEPQDITPDGLAKVGLDLTKLDLQVARRIPEWMARTFFLVAVAHHRNTLTVAMADPSNQEVLERLRRETGCRVLTLQANQNDILEAIGLAYCDEGQPAGPPAEEAGLQETAPPSPAPAPDLPASGDSARDLLAAILTRAAERQAQEIYLDPSPDNAIVRLRVHGRLEWLAEASLQEHQAVIRTVRQGAPDGDARFLSFQDGARTFRFAWHLLPTLHGDSLLIHLHDQQSPAPDMQHLDLDTSAHQRFTDALKRRDGMICLTGLPGHGHRTTWYAAMQHIKSPDIKMVTLEHGIGCPLAGVTQVPLRPEKGQTYAGMLREALLHNPDVVALEEAPDRETVSLALHAAAAGRLVLSTVYAADGVACLYTLLRMGISPLLVARTVTLILAQYRLKRLCSKCKTSTYPTEGMLNRLSGLSAGRIPAMWYFGAGCEACGMTGFHGQVTIYEALPVTPSLQQAILDDATHEQLRRAAEQTGYATLLDAGLENVAQGLTSLEEVLRLPVGH